MLLKILSFSLSSDSLQLLHSSITAFLDVFISSFSTSSLYDVYDVYDVLEVDERSLDTAAYCSILVCSYLLRAIRLLCPLCSRIIFSGTSFEYILDIPVAHKLWLHLP